MDFIPNDHQLRAIIAAGHCSVLACPGSGKTSVLSERAARLLNENSMGRLCAVTFTRDAAQELKGRILKLCPTAAKRLAVGTFHSIALNQLKRSGWVAHKLLSDGERLALLRRCYRQIKCDVPFTKVVAAIDAAKSRLSSMAFDHPSIEDVMTAYQGLLDSERGMDFSDILLLSTKGMLSQQVAPLPVRWLLVDEAQDMDDVQCEWVLAHGENGIEITIVGDDDQSLYAFRHALGYAGMQRISNHLSAQTITLPINYRCAPNILAHAAQLIAQNNFRANKIIRASRVGSGVVSNYRAADRLNEAVAIVKAIKQSDSHACAILARTNALLETVEAVLITENIQYTITGGKSVWNGITGSAFIGLLKSVSHGGWTGMANALSICGISPSLLNMHMADKDCQWMLDMILEALPHDNKGERRVVASLRRGYATWCAHLAKGNIDLVVHAISLWFCDYCKGDRAGLIAMLAEIIAKMRGSLTQRLNALARNNDAETSGVVLMTLHSSKGLEFDHVWIMGAEDNNLPHPDSSEEEERRLFYVGITRARNRLAISSSIDDGFESRFIVEAGLNSLQRHS